MGLTRKDESIVVRLSSGIEEAKENKNKILGYVNGLKEKCENREITYSEYEQLLNKKRDGKTIKQWLGVYDSYIKDCGSKIENEEMRSAGKKILAVFLFFLFISLVSVILFYFRGSIIGLVVQEQTQEYTEQLNLTFSSSASHEWQIQNFGQLNSVKLSGLIEGEGEVKVYLDDYLILDSSNIKTKQAGLTGLAVDEAAPEPSSSPAPESSPAPSAETPSESPQASSTESTPAEAPSEPASSTPSETQPSYSEEQGAQSPKQSETAPSQPQNEPPSSSEQSEEPAVPEIPPEETASEENVTEVQPQENITGITPKENTTETNVTQPTAPSGETGVEKPKEKQIRRFNRICEETCDLSSLNLNKSSYSLRIEINNASVSLEEIIYEILIEKQALNETIESNESVINLTDANVTLINTTSSGIVIGQPVKWTKRVELDKPGKIKVKLPKEAENISVNKIKSYSEPISSEQSEEPAVFSITSSITGQVIEENKPGFFTRLFSSLTGRAVTTEESSQSKDLVIEDNASEYEITYETPAPEATEINISENQKQIIISAPDLGYENVLAFTNLSKEVPINQIALYHETENNQRVQLKAYDNNRNGLIDYVEWIVPHLSNQSYMLVIEITKAEHLDASRNFISDIYEEVKAIDGIWSEAVGEGEYVRLTFEENLTKYSDIKIYARGVNSRIEVYAKDSNELITTFENINEEGWYRVYLNNLGDKSYNSFDLKILGSVEFDYVIDPNLNLEIIGSIDTYTASVFLKTNPDSTSGFDAYDIESNPPPSDYAEFYSNITYAGTEYHLAVDSWNASENPRTLYLIYYIDSAQTGSLNFSWASLEGSEYYMNFTYYGTDSTYTTPIASRDMRTNTGYNASITSASYLYVKIGYSEDTTAPNIVVKSPTNTTYNTSTVTFNVSSNENLSFCKFTINNWEYNYTMTRKNDTYFNFTNTSIADGSYIAKYWCNDTANNTNSSQTIAFAVDTIYPLINLTYPMNITYNYVTHSLNYTYAEVGCDSVWYSLNLGVTNSSRQNCGLNWSGLTASEGSNTWMVYINDTVNHLNSSRRTFTVDTTKPTINIVSPTNITYNTTTITFNVSTNENTSWCGFSLDGSANITMTRKNDTYFNFTNSSMTQGGHSILFACNDTLGNMNASSGTRSFAVDTIYPLINLTYPMNITYNYVTHSLNYTYAEVGCDSVWYSLNLGVTNSSRQNCGLNWSGLTASEGSNTWMVYINDTVNHLNSSRRTFTVDTTPPNINISSPANTTYAVSWINFNISSNENLSFCKFTINNWEYNYTMTRKNDTYFNFTNSSMKDGSYTAKYWCNDTMNNINNSEKVTFIISTNNPPSNPTVTINSTDGSNKTLQDLWCRATISDPDSNLLNVSVEWYKENSYQFRLDYNNSYTSGTLFNASLHNANTTKGDNWSCGIRLHDGADYSNWVNSSKLRILNTAPEIIRVYNQSMAVTINEGPDPSFAEINFTAYDPDSASDLSDATSYANLSFPSEDLRNVSVCQKKQSSGDYANYTCNITMWWWDVNDTWTANVYIKDTEGTPALNSTVQAVGEQLSIINGSASLIAWPGLMPGTINQTASSSLLINNIGNIPLTNLPINATNLRGETDDTKYLWAANFSAGTETGPLKPECAGTSMRHGLFTQIESSVLPRGNYTKNDGTAQEELYFCLRVVGSDLTQVQAYSTSKEGAWAVDILQLALLTIVGRRKKKNKLKEKTINSPLITRRLREEKIPISIFKKQLGGLEAVVKYLKENLQLTYHEIAELLNRNERTIWTAYNKSKDKMPEKFETEKTDILVPLRIFSTEQTALEAVIAYLKEKQLKNKQIAELLNRDERNIWTIYNLAKSKIKKAGKQEIKPEIELEEIKDKITIPISIFTKQLGGLETVVKYMKENLQLTYHEIAELLNRNERTIWTAYNKSKDKMPEKLEIRKGLMLPLRIFSTKLTALKAAISYLKEKQMQYVEIAELLNRDERNIWTIYNRTIKHAFP